MKEKKCLSIYNQYNKKANLFFLNKEYDAALNYQTLAIIYCPCSIKNKDKGMACIFWSFIINVTVKPFSDVFKKVS